VKRIIVIALVLALWLLSGAEAGRHGYFGGGHFGGGHFGGGYFGGGFHYAPQFRVSTPSVHQSFHWSPPRAPATFRMPSTTFPRSPIVQQQAPAFERQPQFAQPHFLQPHFVQPHFVEPHFATGNLPGSQRAPVSQGPAKAEVGKWRQLPGERSLYHAARPSAAATKEFHEKLRTAMANRQPKFDERVQQHMKDYQARATAIRDRLRPEQHNWFTNKWWKEHSFAHRSWWHHHHHDYPWPWWWQWATWQLIRQWLLSDNLGPPFFYDYGGNVITQGNMVYVNGAPVATAPAYAAQAYALAAAPPPAPDAALDWMPLGVFALSTSQADTNPSYILQLAMAKQGLVSGTYFNPGTNQSGAVDGRVDSASQRVAIRLSDPADIVLETGVYNLTQDSTPVLVHFGLQQTQTWFLVRLQAPRSGE
jgi:hypothetical protein